MSKVIVATSGKGGVGKTTTAAAIATCLARAGEKTIAVDIDIGLRNLDLALGFEGCIVHDLMNVASDEVALDKTVIRDQRCRDLDFLAAPQVQTKSAMTEEGLTSLVAALRTSYDWIVLDTPAGIEASTMWSIGLADHALIVTNPELASIRDADRVLGLIAEITDEQEAEGKPVVQSHLLVTRYDPYLAWAGDHVTYSDLVHHLQVPLLGVIPESRDVLRSANRGESIAWSTGLAAQTYQAATNRLRGHGCELRVPEKKRPNLMARMAMRYQ